MSYHPSHFNSTDLSTSTAEIIGAMTPLPGKSMTDHEAGGWKGRRGGRRGIGGEGN